MTGRESGGSASTGFEEALMNAPGGEAGTVQAHGLPAYVRIGRAEVVIVDAGEYRTLRGSRTPPGPYMPEPALPSPAAVIFGVEVVTIPTTLYAELLDCKRRLAVLDVTPARLLANPRCRIDHDPAVAAFLAECLGQRLLKDTHTLCRERFGADRTPGKSTIQRYWARLGRTT
ncbi:hypothetical protein [Methylobacterium sp. sgz302541]|uniref:hypothetical protein n=1 Tax=unclassified Methylobacterium TaxID=2615210 RepID=UPI003D34D4B0